MKTFLTSQVAFVHGISWSNKKERKKQQQNALENLVFNERTNTLRIYENFSGSYTYLKKGSNPTLNSAPKFFVFYHMIVKLTPSGDISLRLPNSLHLLEKPKASEGNWFAPCVIQISVTKSQKYISGRGWLPSKQITLTFQTSSVIRTTIRVSGCSITNSPANDLPGSDSLRHCLLEKNTAHHDAPAISYLQPWNLTYQN